MTQQQDKCKTLFSICIFLLTPCDKHIKIYSRQATTGVILPPPEGFGVYISPISGACRTFYYLHSCNINIANTATSSMSRFLFLPVILKDEKYFA